VSAGSASETRTLYHYTAPTTSHLGSILQEGRIRLAESNLSFEVRHAGPDVVWLTDSRDPQSQEWASGPDDRATGPGFLPPEIKTRAVLTVELSQDRVHHWPGWSEEHGIDPAVSAALAATGGDPAAWWVATAPVSRWDVSALVIAPFRVGDQAYPLREFAGGDLRRLFESVGARRALELIGAVKR